MENCIKNNQPKIILISAEIEIFYEKINNYRNTLNLIYDYLSHFFSNFYSDHIIITGPLTVIAVAGAGYYVYNKINKKRKRVKLSDDDFKL